MARLGGVITLLLFAAVVHLARKSGDFPRRLRVLRNLIEASADGLRAEAMPTLLASVRRYVVDGTLSTIAGFHRGQLDEEIAKAAFLAAHPALAPTLFALEDHPLLRGCLAAFSLDASVFAARAVAFERVFADRSAWDELTGSLLACGDYGQTLRYDRWRLGSSSDSEEVLINVSRRPRSGARRHAASERFTAQGVRFHRSSLPASRRATLPRSDIDQHLLRCGVNCSLAPTGGLPRACWQPWARCSTTSRRRRGPSARRYAR